MHPILKTPLALTAMLMLAGALTACSERPAAPEPVRAVRTLTVAPQSTGATLEYAAEIRARDEVRLGFRVGGKMVRRAAEVGQRVKAGDVLAELDASDLRLTQAAARAAVQAAQVNVELAQADHKRFKELRDEGFIGGAEFERREGVLKASQAQLEQAQAQAAVQVNQAGYTTLHASTAGVVTAVEAEVGAVLAAGTPVLRLAPDGPRDVVFAVPEDRAAAMRGWQGKPGALRVQFWGRAGTVPATLREIAAAADPATRTFLAKADLGATVVQIGQTASVLVDLPRQPGVAILPLAAVLEQQGRSVVWLLDEASMTVSQQPILVAGADGNSVVVASGLNPGQVVVTAGVHALSPGQKVRHYRPAAVATPAAAAASR
ncbi:MAG: efflux RND transporter periplasmic adaptor subunit [Rubrivivax sp.]|nr:efflux RND transporter periplasmic adaptor subunit [Rubrivivax sp.]